MRQTGTRRCASRTWPLPMESPPLWPRRINWAATRTTGEPPFEPRSLASSEMLEGQGIPLKILPGGDVRIEPELVNKLHSGEVLSVADRRRHVLLELPHEIYAPSTDCWRIWTERASSAF